MIVVDSSALVAIMLTEPEAETFSDLVGDDGAPHMSAVTLFETRIVLSARQGAAKLHEFEQWLRIARVVTVDFDTAQSELAFSAYHRFGKGYHPAALNLGDCASYALAKSLDAPLLFKGNDFRRTDVRPAL